MTESVLKKEMDHQTVILTLNRPEVMNSFNFEMLYALRDAVDAIRFDPEIRVVVITGA